MVTLKEGAASQPVQRTEHSRAKLRGTDLSYQAIFDQLGLVEMPSEQRLDQLATVVAPERYLLPDPDSNFFANLAQIEFGHTEYDWPIPYYLLDIGKYRFITSEEEVTLGWIKELGLCAEHGGMAGLPQPEILQCAELGRQAQARLTEVFSPYVLHLAPLYNGLGTPFPDLIQEGYLGLLASIKNFDPGLNVSFRHYSRRGILQAISRYVRSKKTGIRIPIHMLERRDAIARFMSEYSEENGDAPSVELIAHFTGISVAKIKASFAAMETQNTFSLDAENVDGVTLVEQLASTDQVETPELLHQALRQELIGALAILTDKQRRVIELRYGLTGSEPMSFEEIASTIGTSEANAQQLYSFAIKTWRTHRNRRELQAALELTDELMQLAVS